ncbi:MerR family transcriptional regulator [Nocardia sp. PE-7]|uniref:MerR family transcriptional regulator n=1 Tax=Nocardia sp. PE-7 TaxID=3058426 RepID=UPI002657BE70|nr:MerR family transcriptional regulator [Nocardia sp. PE-7]WKG11863.1 MerR family transcriptional regulator [Nocardia sp. PE-7]
MTWSTSEVAQLAGTTLRTVRHYHDIGLLELPARAANGYKQYGVEHLLSLIRIRRLVGLGLTLPEIAGMSERREHPSEALRRLDAQLEQEMTRIQQRRDQLAVLLRDAGDAADLGIELAPIADHPLTEPDRSFLVVLARIVSPRILDAYLAMIEATRADPVLAELDALAPDADVDTRAELAERMSRHLDAVHAEFPDLLDVTVDAPVGPRVAGHALRVAIEELYNPAQIDVLARTSRSMAASGHPADQDRSAES